MTWEEEFRRLDAERAAGRISAEEHRARREALSGRQSQYQQPEQASPGQSPFPPAFRWADSRPQLRPVSSGEAQQPASQQPASQQQAPDQAASAETTQVIPGQLVRGSPEADRTRMVSYTSPAGPPPQQAGWPNQQYGPQQQSTQQQDAHQQDMGYGWKPPVNHAQWGAPVPPAPDGRRQGAEVFETAGKRSQPTRLVFGILVALVVLALAAAGGVYALVSTNSPQPQPKPAPPAPAAAAPSPAAPSPAAPNPASPSPASPSPASPNPVPAALTEPPPPKPAPATTPEILAAVPPGPPSPFNGLLNPPDLQGPKAVALPAPAHDLALQTGAVDGWFSGTDAIDPRTSLIAVRMPDQNAASGVVNAYLGAQQGLSPVDELSYKGVPALSNGTGVFHTAYVSNNWAVVVEVSGQQAGAADLFKNVLGQQVAQSPPTVR